MSTSKMNWESQLILMPMEAEDGLSWEQKSGPLVDADKDEGSKPD